MGIFESSEGLEGLDRLGFFVNFFSSIFKHETLCLNKNEKKKIKKMGDY
jgi:hypothetical protein